MESQGMDTGPLTGGTSISGQPLCPPSPLQIEDHEAVIVEFTNLVSFAIKNGVHLDEELIKTMLINTYRAMMPIPKDYDEVSERLLQHKRLMRYLWDIKKIVFDSPEIKHLLTDTPKIWPSLTFNDEEVEQLKKATFYISSKFSSKDRTTTHTVSGANLLYQEKELDKTSASAGKVFGERFWAEAARGLLLGNPLGYPHGYELKDVNLSSFPINTYDDRSVVWAKGCAKSPEGVIHLEWRHRQ